jgi:hypothetical protein
MGWETRRNGRKYLYRTVHLPDGRSTKRYLGCGEVARKDDERLQQRQKGRQDLQALVRSIAEPEALANVFQEHSRRCVLEEMSLFGYSNHRSRGWRRSTKHAT